MTSTDTHNAPPAMVGRYPMPGGRFGGDELLPVSQRELGASAWFWQDILETFGFSSGAKILLTSTMDQAVQLYPTEQAAADLNFVICSAEPTFFDAGRVESILRRFSPVALIGATAATLEGLRAASHDPAALLAGMSVWAWPNAVGAVAALADTKLYRIAEVGPALAIECVKGAGLHYDSREWDIVSVDGLLRVSSRMLRAMDFSNSPTGVAGDVDHSPCTCGLTHPRLKLGQG